VILPKVTIDFETRSAVAPAKVGAWGYSLHETTSPLCLAWKVPEGAVRIWIPDAFHDAIWAEDPELMTEFYAPLEELYDLIRQGYLVEAHNAFFERSIWANVMVPRYGAPPVPHEAWRCSMSKAAAAGWPLNLKDLGAALGLTEQKDDAGHRMMLTVSKPRRLKDKSKIHWHEDGQRLSTVFRYCIQDVVVEEMASDILPDLSADELRIWQLDQAINERGIYCDVPMCVAAEAINNELQDELNMELESLTAGAVTTAGQVAKLVEWLRSTGCMVGDLRRETVEWVLDGSKCPFQVTGSARRALEIRLSLSRSSVKKYTAMKMRAAADQRIRDTQLYCGAHTGRWSGKGIQPQNYPADRTGWLSGEADGEPKNYDTVCDAVTVGSLQWLRFMYEKPSTALALTARGALRAAPGHDLVVADFASIEARALLWMARDVNLDRIRRGEDLYKFLASRIYSKPVESIQKGSVERFVGKTGVLGLGYGMGWKKFQLFCEMAGVMLSEAQAKLAVTTYRKTFFGVPELWNAMERQAILAVQYPDREFSVNGLIRWFMVTDHEIPYLCCELPSGRLVRYPRPSAGTRTPPWENAKPQPALFYEGFIRTGTGGRRWGKHDTWGGTLVENVIQAFCRDLLAYSMLRVEAAGYPVVLSVHDELVSEVRKAFGSVEHFEELMEEIPSWATGMPVAAEGWRGERYRK
jgi:DNA polymerase